MSIRHLATALMLAAAPLTATAHSENAKLAPGDLRSAGKIDFPISCTKGVQAEFNRGVALLHSFFYEESRNIFTKVAAQDPACAMAQWGIAQTWWHPIWAPPQPHSRISCGPPKSHRQDSPWARPSTASTSPRTFASEHPRRLCPPQRFGCSRTHPLRRSCERRSAREVASGAFLTASFDELLRD